MVPDLSLREGACQRCGAVERLARSGHCEACQLEIALLLEAILWRRRARQLTARLPVIRAVPPRVRAKPLPMGLLVLASLLLLVAALLLRVR